MVIVCFPGDEATPLKGKPGATVSINKFIHLIISLDDVKVVKNAMNMTVNDVLFGIVQAGLSRYLNQRYDNILHHQINFTNPADMEKNSKLRKVLEKSLHGVIFFNLRPNRIIEKRICLNISDEPKLQWIARNFLSNLYFGFRVQCPNR
ncbi:hypothetical protein YC2023_064637 [Brassica napus]